MDVSHAVYYLHSIRILPISNNTLYRHDSIDPCDYLYLVYLAPHCCCLTNALLPTDYCEVATNAATGLG